MSMWHGYHVYYSDIDRLLVECVSPVIQDIDSRLETCFWERHYAGGSHLRIRLRGSSSDLAASSAELLGTVRDFLQVHPSAVNANYSERQAALMMALEEEVARPEDLRYRVNEIREVPYPRGQTAAGNDDATALAEDFRHDSMALAVAVLRGPRPKREQILRLYFLQALFPDADLPRGSVSYKSHWEGFAAAQPSVALVERIRASYREHADEIRDSMLSVADTYRGGTVDRDPVLGPWLNLLQRYSARARGLPNGGRQVTRQVTTLTEARRLREAVNARLHRPSKFLDSLFHDERFIASVQFDPGFLVPRILTNLLYMFVSSVGLSVIDKMSLCHHAHRAAEEYFDCDLDTILQGTIARVIERYAHQLS